MFGGTEIGEQASAGALVAEASRLREGEGDAERFAQLFRACSVQVEVVTEETGHALPCVPYDGSTWVPVFSELAHMAEFLRACERGSEEVQHGALTGAELLDSCLPMLPRGTGLLLDPMSEHVLALPPVVGIVPAELAVDRGAES